MEASLPTFFRAWRWLRAHPYTAGGMLALVLFLIPFLFHNDLEWEAVFLGAARHLRAGQDIYKPADAYLYPPFMAWALIPLTRFDVMSERAVWWLVNAVSVVVLFRGAWRLAGGGRLQGQALANWREHLAACLGGAGALLYVENCLAHRQTDLVLAALLVLGCLALKQGRALVGAACLGLAAALKCTPLLWAPYLAWRGRPLAAAWLVVVALGVNVLPDLTHPNPSGRPWLAEYYTRYLRPMTGRDYVPGTWTQQVVYNQSLAGACNRWFTTQWLWAPDDCLVESRSNPPSPPALRGLLLCTELFLLGAVLIVCGRPFRHVADHVDSIGRRPLEYSVVMLLMLLLSPMSSRAHFAVLVVPGFLLARRAVHRGRGLIALLLLGSLLMAAGACKDPLGERLYTLLLWYGTAMWQTLFLLAGCLVLLARENSRVEVERPPETLAA